MASRLARTSLSAPIRSTLTGTARTVPLIRLESSVPSPKDGSKTSPPTIGPKAKAQSLLESLPSNSLLSKAAILSSASGLGIFAISNEYYVVNEETVVAVALLSIWIAVFKYGGPAYSQWAEGQITKVKGILDQAREDHKDAVRSRINTVKKMEGVVDVTKALFGVSKETAKLEAQAYELEQKTAIAAEAKAVLDSWVRYEGQVKVKQQKELSDAIISRVRKELENQRVLQQILNQSIVDVERIVSSKTQ